MEVGSWLENVKKIKTERNKLKDTLEEAGVSKPLWHGSHVKKLKEEVGELIKQCETFRELVVDGCETSRERLFSTQLHGEALKRELDNILTWVEAKSDRVPIIGIHGMGGVGKTTLAKHIYKHICRNLHVYWITVSQEADINNLQNVLAEKLNFDLPKCHDIEEKAYILHTQLIDRKNVVLILDDMWKYFDLEKIGILPRVDGCKVIITSRIRDVCRQMGCKEMIKVQPLSQEEAWELFLEKLHPNYMIIPEVEAVAKEMAKKCSGLPLAIITVARSMIGVDDVHGWRDALEELKKSTMGQNDINAEVLPILRYSYNRLRDRRLQQCFLYCSLYPEDFQIQRDELISLFISEGLMHQRDSRAAEFDQGHKILNDLVNACLLETDAHNKYGKSFVTMHDLVREMAIEITRNNPRFMTKACVQLHEIPNEQVWKGDLDKVSLMHNEIVEIPEDLSPRCLRLSTLILSHNRLVSIPNSLFARMPGLQVLNLSFNRHIETLPNSISELENLKALLLGSCTGLHYVPSLRKLKELRELDLRSTRLRQVPVGMECLVKLKCLDMSGTDKLEEFPRGLLPRLSHLQCLLLPWKIEVESEEAESLKLLNVFQGRVDANIFSSKWFNKSPPLTGYKIRIEDEFFYDNEFHFAWFSPDRSMLAIWSQGVLEPDNKFLWHPRLYQTISCRCSFKRDGRDMVSLPHNIQFLEFHNCKGLSSCLEDTLRLYHAKGIQGCGIETCDEIESIMRLSTSTSNHDGPLQNLECLYILQLPNLIGLIKLEPRDLAELPPPGTFSSLKVLYISECQKIKKLFPHNLAAHNLEELKVFGCDQMEEIIEKNEGVGVGSTSNSNTIAFPKLKIIILLQLPQLDSFCKGEIICCDSIKSIEVQGCRQLRRLPLHLPLVNGQPSPPPSLGQIIVTDTKEEEEWWKSLEWDHPKANSVLHPFLGPFPLRWA